MITPNVSPKRTLVVVFNEYTVKRFEPLASYQKIIFIIIIIYFHYYSPLSKLGLGGTYLLCSVACMPGSRYRGR